MFSKIWSQIFNQVLQSLQLNLQPNTQPKLQPNLEFLSPYSQIQEKIVHCIADILLKTLQNIAKHSYKCLQMSSQLFSYVKSKLFELQTLQCEGFKTGYQATFKYFCFSLQFAPQIKSNSFSLFRSDATQCYQLHWCESNAFKPSTVCTASLER